VRNTSDNKFWPRWKRTSKTSCTRRQDLPTGGPRSSPSALRALQARRALSRDDTPNISFREAAAVIVNAEASLVSSARPRGSTKRSRNFSIRCWPTQNAVLIEATIAEVLLSNQYQQGIDGLSCASGLDVGAVDPDGTAAGLPSTPGVPTFSRLTPTGGPIFPVSSSCSSPSGTSACSRAEDLSAQQPDALLRSSTTSFTLTFR